MINVMQMKPHARPFNIVNLTALLLTALPAAYSNALHDEFVAVFVNGETANLKFEEIVFDNYEESLLLNLPNRARTINVISQQYWLHCSLVRNLKKGYFKWIYTEIQRQMSILNRKKVDLKLHVKI